MASKTSFMTRISRIYNEMITAQERLLRLPAEPRSDARR